MNNISISVRLVSGFILIALLTLILGFIGYSSISNSKNALKSIADLNLPAIEALGRIQIGIVGLVGTQRGMLIPALPQNERQAQYKAVMNYRDAYQKATKEYEALPRSAETARLWEDFQGLVAIGVKSNNEVFAKIKEWESTPDQINILASATEMALGPARDANLAALKALDNIINLSKSIAEKTRTTSFTVVDSNIIVMIVLMVVIPTLAILLGLYLTYSILTPLKKGMIFAAAVAQGNLNEDLDVHQRDQIGHLADSLRVMVEALRSKISEAEQKGEEAHQESEKAKEAMIEADEAREKAEHAKAEGMFQAATQLESIVEIITSASEQLSAQIEQSSRGAEEQSRRVGDAATSMEEMNSTVLEVAKNASNASSTADQAKAKAEAGSKVVSHVVRGIEQVQQHAQEMKNDMGNLGKQAEGIGQILNVISDIADQTNLLALNAAIEAARAGDAGRGFAVVADEVRKLAEKTMTATKEVGQAIRGIQDGTKKNIDNVERSGKAIEEVTTLANTSGESLREIVSLAEATTDQVRSIATASEEQSSASEEINRSIEDVNRVSMETYDAMRESAQAVTELANQAQVLKTLIENMKTDSGSTSALPSTRRKVLSQRG